MSASVASWHVWQVGFVVSLIGSLCLVGACGTGGVAAERAPLGRRYKPGDSLDATRLCRCEVCDPVGCCSGSEEPTAECGDEGATAQGDTLAFDEACGIGVKSCAGQCTEEVWRAPHEVRCALYAPEACCRPPTD